MIIKCSRLCQMFLSSPHLARVALTRSPLASLLSSHGASSHFILSSLASSPSALPNHPHSPLLILALLLLLPLFFFLLLFQPLPLFFLYPFLFVLNYLFIYVFFLFFFFDTSHISQLFLLLLSNIAHAYVTKPLWQFHSIMTCVLLPPLLKAEPFSVFLPRFPLFFCFLFFPGP